MITGRAPRRLSALLAAGAAVVGLTACASSPAVPAVPGFGVAAEHAAAPAHQAARYGRPPAISLGRGLLKFPDEASAWVASHRNDPRAGLIAKRIAAYPTALWLTGNESFGNLRQAVSMANHQDRTMVLTLYYIPKRYDGLSAPTSTSLAQYGAWIRKVAGTIGRTRAIITLEPDALWFYDRMANNTDRATRLKALNYAISTLRARAPRARVYIDAGTSSGSVTPRRMATLLVRAGIRRAAGYAVNVSSYSPETRIQSYAQSIRNALAARHLANARYIVDTGRNGAKAWNTSWCNSPGQRLGTVPRLVRGGHGRDLNLWIKAPGTSDGSCGAPGYGAGSYGGQFLPNVAYHMITG